jgi:hypothetical protein
VIKFFIRWAFRLLFLAIVLVVAAVLSLDSIMRVLMEHRIRAQTGMDAEIGRVSIGLLEPRVEILDLKLFNPPDFGGTPFLNIPEIHVEYDRAALALSKLHLTLVRFNLGELDIVRNEKGQTNLFGLAMGAPLQKSAGPGPNPATAEFQRQTGLTFQSVDALNVSIGTFRYIDLKDPRHNRTQKIGRDNYVMKNVKSPVDLAGLAFLIALRSGDFFTSLMGEKTPGGGMELLRLLQ